MKLVKVNNHYVNPKLISSINPSEDGKSTIIVLNQSTIYLENTSVKDVAEELESNSGALDDNNVVINV
ncbi:hypothetical protein QAS_4040 [Clostridioides difficile CD9]|uniref:hypothetical protein n=1 Tax=Clostridioides difficile TaxID=1496 RepID=UPI00038CAD41|nr:hypothetical protein [Clostridioides difficile]EQE01178.1 hypothetical protein QAS_4040 [Clostridioides difficile CD9]